MGICCSVKCFGRQSVLSEEAASVKGTNAFLYINIKAAALPFRLTVCIRKRAACSASKGFTGVIISLIPSSSFYSSYFQNIVPNCCCYCCCRACKCQINFCSSHTGCQAVRVPAVTKKKKSGRLAALQRAKHCNGVSQRCSNLVNKTCLCLKTASLVHTFNL